MILKGPGAQYRRGHSFGCVHKRADVSSWMRRRTHMLDPRLAVIDVLRKWSALKASAINLRIVLCTPLDGPGLPTFN